MLKTSDRDVLTTIGRELGLDVNKLFSVELAATVASNYVTLSQHVQEVPHFIFRDPQSSNGVEVNGTRSVSEWESVIDSVLQKCVSVAMDIPGPHGNTLSVPGANATSPVSHAFDAQHNWVPESWSYTDADFSRLDETDDSTMYSFPRFVNHLDDSSISAVRSFYSAAFSSVPSGFSVLDLCSSWTSHFPREAIADARVVVHGLNEAELFRNSQATECHVQDLNKESTLPWKNDTFEFVTLAMSVQYLTRPQEVFSEIHRVLKPGGMAIVVYSNRCFIDKTINLWAKEVYDGEGHAHVLRKYFLHSPHQGWAGLSSIDMSPKVGDPVWIVSAVKAA